MAEEKTVEEVPAEVKPARRFPPRPSRPVMGNVVLVGMKPTMNYVISTVLQFNEGADKVILKARGRSISKAVDAAEITRLRFLADQVEVGDVKIGTDKVGEGETIRNVSTIEITLVRKGVA